MAEKSMIPSGDLETYTLRGPAEIGTYVGDARIQPLDADPGAFIAGIDLNEGREERLRSMRIATLRLLMSRPHP